MCGPGWLTVQKGVLMGSATAQGQLWGIHAQDLAAYLGQVALPLHGAVLDAAHVTPGTRLLDARCGAGLLALLASLRGVQVTALDASAALLAIARERLPAADVREGDLEALPFADTSFDAVTAVNSIFYAADMAAAAREPARLPQPGALAAVLQRAGLRVVDEGEVACPFVFPSAEVSWRAHCSAGPNQLAIAH